MKKSKQQLMTEILNIQVTTSILDNIIEGLWVKDLDGRYVLVSESFARRHGLSGDEITGKTDFDLHSAEQAAEYTANDRLIIDEMRTRVFLERELPPEGYEQYFEVRKSPIKDFAGNCVGTLGVSRDITERIKMEEELLYISQHDALTGLFNRLHFEKLPDRLSSSGINDIGLIICDVDGLKLTNDTLGHQAGDAVLVRVAGLLQVAVANRGTTARIGGDEFAAIVPLAGVAELEAISAEVYALIEQQEPGLGIIPVSVSCGYSSANLTKETFGQLFKRVDDALQKEKLLRSQSHRSALAAAAKEMLKARDFMTGEHGDRLETLVCQIAKKVGLKAKELNELKLFAQFHDLGKIGVPDQILFKPGPLTAEETVMMRRHPQIGFRIANSIPEWAVIADWILKHHEWFDGSGYPLGLAGENIPLECRIVTIADAYDAMISDRPYRKALPKKAAVAELLKYSGRQFDPALVKIFLGIVG